MVKYLVSNVLKLVVLFTIVNADKKCTDYTLGLLEASPLTSSSNQHADICFTYSSDCFEIPSSFNDSFKLISPLFPINCEESISNSTIINKMTKGDILLLKNSTKTCNISLYLQEVSKGNGSGIMLISGSVPSLEDSYNLDIFMVTSNTFSDSLKTISLNNEDVKIKFLPPLKDTFDFSIVCLGLIALFCVVVGSYTGPLAAKKSELDEQQRLNSQEAQPPTEKSTKYELYINITMVFVMVIFISTVLLLLYFYYDYLVYFFIGVFCLASGRSTYYIFLQILNYFNIGKVMPSYRNCGLHEAIIATLSLALPIVWFFLRHESYAWTIQDFLGICFCVHMIQTISVPNLKICSLLLALLFIYDIFFVFVTPYFTSDGTSVMVQVATGGQSKESLPLLMKLPHLNFGRWGACFSNKYSLLGFGDIVIPGILTSLAHSFDIRTNSKCHPYFTTGVTGYSLGIVSAFVALYLSSTGQPALLYIVPSTLVPIIIVALWRKEFKSLWSGIQNTVTCDETP